MSIAAVGDILLPPKPLDWDDKRLIALAGRLRGVDFALGNMESPLVDSGLPIPKIDIARADRSQGKHLARLGFSAMTLANNHILDYGPRGLKTTQKTLRRSGIQCVGAGSNLATAFRHVVLEKSGTKIAFLGAHAYYHSTWDHYPDPYRADGEEPGAAVVQGYEVRLSSGQTVIAPAERFLKYLTDAVAKARREADFVVLALHTHWGKDDLTRVDEGRRTIAYAAVDAGADLIFGHGPHVFNGIEFYRGAFIAHSLGNFFFHMPTALEEMVPEVRPFIAKMRREDRYWEGLILEADFSPGKRPDHIRLHAVHLSRDSYGIPHPAGGKVLGRIEERLAAMSEPLGTKVSREGDVLIVRPSH